MDLDSFDRRLLGLLQTDNTRTADELGAAVGLSASACLKRIKKLRQTGVIEADVSIVRPTSLGRPLLMIVAVTLEREQPSLIAAFKESMMSSREVMQCFYVTGENDFVLLVSAIDMAGYETFTQRLLFDNPNVRRFTTQVVMDRVKFSLSIPAVPLS